MAKVFVKWLGHFSGPISSVTILGTGVSQILNHVFYTNVRFNGIVLRFALLTVFTPKFFTFVDTVKSPLSM